MACDVNSNLHLREDSTLCISDTSCVVSPLVRMNKRKALPDLCNREVGHLSPRNFALRLGSSEVPTLVLTLFLFPSRQGYYFIFVFAISSILGSCPSTSITEESAKAPRLCQRCELQCRWWHSGLWFRWLWDYSLGLGNWPH